MKNKAILFIHGFMGHPDEFHILNDLFSAWQYDVHTFVLKGHEGGKIRNATRYDWEEDCIRKIETLKQEIKSLRIGD